MIERVPAEPADIERLEEDMTAPGHWEIKAWDTCGEATITFISDRKISTEEMQLRREVRESIRRQLEDEGSGETNADRAVRRARSEVRRYCRHNDLEQMVTFTFAGEVMEFDSLSATVHNFWKRWQRATGLDRGPYVWVPEWGKVTGRLHIHMAVPWWSKLNCVEVCPNCDKYNVLSKTHRGIPSDYLCVGCLWGLGFVGRPLDSEGDIETNEDGRSLSRYLSKYMAKDLGSELSKGQQRYRVAQGYQPTFINEWADSPTEGVSLAMALLGANLGNGEVITPGLYVM